MTESFTLEAKKPESIQERVYGLMGRLAERHPRQKQLIAGLATLLSVFTVTESRAPETSGAKVKTFEEILTGIQDQKLANQIRYIETQNQGFTVPMPEYAGPATFDHTSISKSLGEADTYTDKESGVLLDTAENVIFGHGSGMAVMENSSTSQNKDNHNLFDSNVSGWKLANPQGGKIESDGDAYTVEGSACTNRRDALMRALEEAGNKQGGITISTEKQLETVSGQTSLDNFHELVMTKNSACFKSYRIKEEREEVQHMTDMNKQPMTITEHIVVLEVVPGKFVPGPEEKTIPPDYRQTTPEPITTN